MKNILSNTARLVSTPGMIGAYSDWLIETLLSNSSPSVKSVNGNRINGFPSFSEFWTFYYGLPTAEEKLLRNCLNNVDGSAIAFDIGANLGLFTVALSSLGYYQVHSFEPVTDTFEKLKSNVSRNNLDEKVYLNCSAIGKDKGTADFKTFEKSPAINRMVVSDPNQMDSHYSGDKISKVAIVSLDEYCSDNAINKIDFVKIDVEGMEPLVIEGARDVFLEKRVKVVLIEICPDNLNEMGFSVEILNRLFKEIDYRPHRLTKNGEVGDQLSIHDLESITLENVLLLP